MSIDVAAAQSGVLDVGRVLGMSWRTLQANAQTLALLGLLLSVTSDVAYGAYGVFVAPAATDAFAALRGGPGQNIVNLVLGLFLTGAVNRVVLADLAGERRLDLAQAFAGVPQMIGSLFVLQLIVGISVILGLILLIVPGLILVSMWACAASALVAERQGFSAALSRSAALTRGNRWRVFGLLVLAGLVYVALIFGIGLAAIVLDGLGRTGLILTDMVIIPLATAAALVFIIVIPAVLYAELRRLKEGAPMGAVAQIFA